MATCYRHPSRQTRVSCSSCGRPICPDCMTPTQVGMRCPECSRQRTEVRSLRTLARSPRATIALIAANVIVFIGEQGQMTLAGEGSAAGESEVGHSGVVLGSGLHGTLIEEGILGRVLTYQLPSGQLIAHLPIAEHQYWRLITAGFLHESVMHIGFNMLLLFLLGRMLEPAIGQWRLLAIYFVALLAGSFGALFATAAPSLGASGAVFGLMGAAAVEIRARGFSVMESGIGALIAINLLLSFTLANISVGAHVGGLIGGALAGWALHRSQVRRIPAAGYLACLALAAAAVAGSIAIGGISTAGIA